MNVNQYNRRLLKIDKSKILDKSKNLSYFKTKTKTKVKTRQ